MTIYATGNAVGSTSPKDLIDNSQNLDYLILGPLLNYPDRRGVNRLSWAGIEASFAAAQAQRASEYSTDKTARDTQYTSDKAARDSEFDADQVQRVVEFNDFLESSGYEIPVDYIAGLGITRPTQVVRFSGELYRAHDANLPFTTTTWAADSAKFFAMGDASLRQELAAPTGAGKSGYIFGSDHSTPSDVAQELRDNARSILQFVPPNQKAAIRDGTSRWDARDAINYAIREFQGGGILVPKGACVAIGGPIDTIRGALLHGPGPYDDTPGVGSKIFLLDGSNCPAFRTPAAVTGSAAQATHFMGLENLIFDCNKAGQTVESELVQFHGAWVGSWLNNVAIHNALGSALTFDLGTDLNVDQVWVLNTQSAAGYAVDTNKSLTGTTRSGLLNIGSIYIENTSNKAGGTPRTVEADRGNNMRLHRLVTAHIGEMHTEGGRRPIDLESNHLVRIEKLSVSYCGLATDADAALVRYVDTGTRAVSIGSMRSDSHAAGTKFVSLATGQTSNNLQELPMENTTVPFVSGYTAVNAAGFGTQRQAPTVFANNMGVQMVGSSASAYQRFYNSNLTNYHYLRINSSVLSIGSNWAQPSLAEKSFLDFTSAGNAADRAAWNVPVALHSRSTGANVVADSVYKATLPSYGSGPVFQRAAGTDAGAEFLVTGRRAGGPPATSADQVPQIYVDISSVPRAIYCSISVGNGAADWLKISN
jgi:hypothetical protein